MEYLALLFNTAVVAIVLYQYWLNQKNITLVFDETEPSDLELAAREHNRLELALAATNTVEDQKATFKAFAKAHFRLLALAKGQPTEKVAKQEPEPDIRKFTFSVHDFAADDPSVILPGDYVGDIEDDDDDEPVMH